MSDDVLIQAVKSVTENVIDKMYGDVIKPTVKPIGELISIPPRVLRILANPVLSWIQDKEETFDTMKSIAEPALRGIDERKIEEPEPYIALPIIQQIFQCSNHLDIREMYQKLLASSMNMDTKELVLPGFIGIVSQLSPDEARLLKFIVKKSSLATLEIRAFDKNRTKTTFSIFVKHYFEYHDNEFLVQNIDIYIDNLVRLGLIQIPHGIYAGEENDYKSLINLFEKEEKFQELFNDIRFEYQYRTIELTSFGKAFAKVCLYNDSEIVCVNS